MVITICGGGALGHVCVGVLSCQKNVTVRLLTNRPEEWTNRISVTDSNGRVFDGKIASVSKNASDVVPGADIVLLCLPGFLIEQTLENVKPYLQNAIVGSIVCNTGFFFFAHKVLGEKARLFGFQRVPFIARVKEYGRCGSLLGYKTSLAIATENIKESKQFCKFVEQLFMSPTTLLNSFYEVSLSNSNPILHTGRLYSMWKNWDGEIYSRCILFYKEWTEDAAQTLIDMDSEFMRLLDVLSINKNSIPRLLDYYESYDSRSLSDKLSSIKAFQTIPAPMRQVDGGWIPDFSSRYFTEDFPFGLRFIVELARKHMVCTPTIDKVFEWGMSKV